MLTQFSKIFKLENGNINVLLEWEIPYAWTLRQSSIKWIKLKSF